MNSPVRVLLVEDDEDDYLFTRDLLAQIEGQRFDLEWVRAYEAAREAICRADHDVYLIDYRLDGRTGLELLQEVIGLGCSGPMIVLTGLSDRMIDIQSMRAGAADYLIKGQINAPTLERSIRYAIERRRAEDSLRRAHNELQETHERLLKVERLAAIGQMVAGLAHESRNALQQIQASLEMLSRRLDGRSEMQFVASIQRAQDRLHRLFEDVRGYAAPIRLSLHVQDLAIIWREAWTELEPAYRGRDVTLEEQLNSVDVHCIADRFGLERLFRNVLENSLAACTDPVRVEISCREIVLGEQPAVELSIRDNGPGLDAEQRSRIFEPFFTTKTRGTGLGMSICKRIVEAHGGQIRVGDAVSGTEIIVALPRGVPNS